MATWNDYSVSLAPQISGFGTPNMTGADYRTVKCEAPSFSFDTAVTELNLLTGQIGAAPERVIGRRSGTFGFKIPLEGLKSGYDPTLENPGSAGVIPPWMCLVANALGSNVGAVANAANFWNGAHMNNSTYQASGVASATTTAITYDAPGAFADVDAGDLVLTAESPTSTTLQLGFAKSAAGNVVTLFEASKNAVNSNTADNYGTATGWLSAAAYSQIPMTIKFTGQDATLAYIMQDFVVEGFQITWNSGEVPTVTINGKFYDFAMDKTAGGLVVPAAFDRVPQIVGSVNGYASLAGSQKCGMESCTLDYAIEVVDIVCHAASQGISAVAYRNPRIRASVQVLHDTADTVYDSAGNAGNVGSHQWQSFLERGVTTSIGCYVGSKVGRAWAFLIPAAYFTAVATEKRGEFLAYKLDVEATNYTGDTAIHTETTTDSPLDSIFRMGVG